MPASTIPAVAPIKGFEGVELDIQHYLLEEYSDVSDAAKELPAVMEWLNELRSAYIEERDVLKSDLEVAEAKAYFDLKGSGDGSYQVNYQCKPTEEGMKMAVALDQEVRRLKEKLAAVAATQSRLTGTLGSLQAKVELLRSSEATRRTTFDDTTARHADRD